MRYGGGLSRMAIHAQMTHTSSPQNLTGIWHGLYSYPYGGRAPVPFVATLIQAGSTVSGTTHETCETGGRSNETLYATLRGRRQDSAVVFLKTYDGGNPHYGRVSYEGRLSADGTEIEGRWIVPGNWSGKFLMIRSAGKEEAVSRKVFERA
jgi:hypothetical protein